MIITVSFTLGLIFTRGISHNSYPNGNKANLQFNSISSGNYGATFYNNLKKINMFFNNKKPRKESLVLPILDEVYAILHISFTIFIVPIYYFNQYILLYATNSNVVDITWLMVLFAVLLSFSTFYICFVIYWNYIHKNYFNVWKLIKIWLDLIKTNKNKKFFYLIVLFIVILLLIFVGLNMLLLNLILSSFGIGNNCLLAYILIRLNLLPFIIYINNIFIRIFIKYSTNDKTSIDYSIFSPIMFKSITPLRLLLVTSFICIASFFVSLLSQINFISIFNRSSINVTIPCIKNVKILDFFVTLVKVDSPLFIEGLKLHDSIFVSKLPKSADNNTSFIITWYRAVSSSWTLSMKRWLDLFKCDNIQAQLSYNRSLAIDKISSINFYKVIFSKPEPESVIARLAAEWSMHRVSRNIAELSALKVQIGESYANLISIGGDMASLVDSYNIYGLMVEFELLSSVPNGRVYTVPLFFKDTNSNHEITKLASMLRNYLHDFNELRIKINGEHRTYSALRSVIIRKYPELNISYINSIYSGHPPVGHVGHNSFYRWLIGRYPIIMDFDRHYPRNINNFRFELLVDNVGHSIL